MKFFGLDITRAKSEAKEAQFETVLKRLLAVREGTFTGLVTPDTCMKSPTVHAIVTAISRRIAVSALHVYRKKSDDGRESKERLTNHPVARLLAYPNSWQSRTNYWMDAVSTFVRYGRFYAWKSRGTTGPIRELLPIHPREMSVRQGDDWKVIYTYGGKEVDPKYLHHVRGPARNFIEGDSPVNDVEVAIALEIAAEKFGASFFHNGALPMIIFSFLAGSSGFKNEEDQEKFKQDFQEKYGGTNRFKGMVLPKGFDKPFSLPIENDKAQMIETRKYQRTVIAGAFGVPPHLVGDLERATFNNVEQQDSDFTLNVVMPVAQAFEAAMERDLLTDEDVNSGVCIRFNLDSILRADFKSRQEGLRVQRDAGVISPNEWREIEGKNPISEDDGGDSYIRPANFVVSGEEPPPEPPPTPEIKPKPDPAKPVDDSISKARKLIREYQ